MSVEESRAGAAYSTISANSRNSMSWWTRSSSIDIPWITALRSAAVRLLSRSKMIFNRAWIDPLSAAVS
jgi:hypothetical protein